MLRDTLKLEIDRLSEAQLGKLAELIEAVKAQPSPSSQDEKIATTERLQRFREWVDSRPLTGISLPDEAFDRGNIYD